MKEIISAFLVTFASSTCASVIGATFGVLPSADTGSSIFPSLMSLTASALLAASQLLPTIFQLLLSSGVMTPPLTSFIYCPIKSLTAAPFTISLSRTLGKFPSLYISLPVLAVK